MLTVFGQGNRVCDGLSRRKLIQIGGAGLFGLSLDTVLRAEEQIQTSSAKAKSVIFLLLFGGPSQLETFDMKPEAPEKIRGPYRPIGCRTPGLQICEHLPKIADISDKICVVRTMSHSFNDHSGGGHYIQTGKRWHVPIGGGFAPTPKDWPSIGSIVEYVDQNASRGLQATLPAYMVLPNSLGKLQEAGQYPRPGEHAGWLGQRYNPLTTRIEKRSLTDNPYWRDCSDEELKYQISGLESREGMTLERMHSRQSLLTQLNDQLRNLDDNSADKLDSLRQRALSLVSSTKAREALDITREPTELRDRYGRHLFGQSCLMARRLIEAGVRFVTVHYDCVDGYSWDSHKNSDDVKKSLLPTFDQAFSSLIADLDQRGMLAETMVVATGEMGRTPKANAEWGRDHWSTLFPAVLAGAKLPGGKVFGESDKQAAFALDNPISPEDLAATIYHALGIDPELRLNNFENRPTPIVDGGSPVLELWS